MRVNFTITGGFRRAKKSLKVLMMKKAAKLGWAGAEAGKELSRNRAGTWQKQSKSRAEAFKG